MNDLTKLREISLQFRRLSSSFLRTTDNDNLVYVKRLYAYLNNEPVVKRYIDDALLRSDYDYEQFITLRKFTQNQYEINVPENEIDHVKAMYNFLEYLATDEQVEYLAGIALSFGRSSKNYNELIQVFLDKTFKHLINFITDSLSRDMMALEQNKANMQITQNIFGNQNTANAGETIISGNTYGQNNLKDLISLMSIFQQEVLKYPLDEEEKIFVLDDLIEIKEQAESDTPNLTRIKKAVNGVKKFINDVTSKVAANVITSNTTSLLESGREFIEKASQIFN